MIDTVAATPSEVNSTGSAVAGIAKRVGHSGINPVCAASEWVIVRVDDATGLGQHFTRS